MSYEDVTSRLAAAVEAAGRPPGSVALVAVSKVQPQARVASVLEAGHRVFGENRIQEAADKWPRFRERFGPCKLHLVGALQSNKARQAMELFDVIQTLDRPKLARTVARLADEIGRCPDLFVQVNVGEEPQKAGIAPGEADAFVAECRGLGLPIRGLMCIPPVDDDPSGHFDHLVRIAARNGIEGLSMGMSADFEIAIARGATHVRVGSALFGARTKG